MSARLAVLGGAGGIGRVLVLEAVRAGYEPVVLDLPASLEAHQPQEVENHALDATDAPTVERVAGAVGPLAGFVNLCGFMAESDAVVDTPPQTVTEVIAGNLIAAFHAARAFAPKILEGGAMVQIGSGLGHFARPGYGPYAAAKAGIAALTRQLALELAPKVRVNAVAPSAVETAFLRGGTGRSDEAQPARFDPDAYGRAVPLGRIARPEDITGPILFLLSPAARYMTGQILHVNGGTYMP